MCFLNWGEMKQERVQCNQVKEAWHLRVQWSSVDNWTAQGRGGREKGKGAGQCKVDRGTRQGGCCAVSSTLCLSDLEILGRQWAFL